MWSDTLRTLAEGAVAGSAALSGISTTGAHPSAARPYVGQTISVVYFNPPPPKADLDRFTAQTGIKVQWTTIGWDNLQTKITASAVAHAYFADATDVDWSRVGQYYRLKWFMPLNSYFDPASLRADVPQLSSFTYNNVLVGMPVDSSFTVTTINV